MTNYLDKIPEHSKDYIRRLVVLNKIKIFLKKNRKTKYGDFTVKPNGQKLITINSDLNIYRFLITLLHEIAHFLTYNDYGFYVKPHGIEWKNKFKNLLLPIINPNIFPSDVLKPLAFYAKNPKASTDSDLQLSLILNKFDKEKVKYVFQLKNGSEFKIHNGKKFKLIRKIRKRYECKDLLTKKLYLFNPNYKICI